jgi:hypothetical protein
MKCRSSFRFSGVIVALVIAGGAGLGSRWRQTMSLRTELELARAEVGELEKLRDENKRLRDQQLPVAELEALRADHVALPRLRAELEALNRPTAP